MQVTHKVQLGDQGADKLGCVILPAMLTRDHGPVGVRVLWPHPAILLENITAREKIADVSLETTWSRSGQLTLYMEHLE